MTFDARVRDQWPDKADQIIGLIRGSIDPDTFADVTKWVAACYHPPSKHERIACALNEVLEGYGIEAVFRGGELEPALEYVNMGDTYVATLLYDGRWKVGTWGDYVERHGL